MSVFFHYPDWLKPEVFHGINFPPFLNFLSVIRWYGMMYILGLFIFITLAKCLIKSQKATLKTINEQTLDDIFFPGVLGLIFGGRIFYCIVYEFSYFASRPLEIILPFNFSTGQFTGFSGMSYHGAVIGIFIACTTFIAIKKLDLREITDIIFPAAPLGYSLGRLGNFINAELYGRVTASPVGMIFPDAQKLPLNLNDVQNVITKLGWQINEITGIVTTKSGEIIDGVIGRVIINSSVMTAINLPRHPSQLYEFLFEGIVLFFLMWFVFRKYKPFAGFLGPAYIAGYAFFRFFIEFFRQPDYQFSNYEAGKFVGTIAGGLSMGQILSILMFLSAIAFGVYLKYLYKPKSLHYLETATKKK